MKDLNLIVWLSQLGLSVVVPLAGFILLAVWLRDRLGLGNWVLWIGIALGLYSAIHGLIQSLKVLSQQSEKTEDSPPPVSFNDHD